MSNPTDSAPAWITTDYLQKLLREFFNDDSIYVHDLKIGPGSEIGDGYVSQIFRLEVNYTKQNTKEFRSIIGKAIPFSELSQELCKSFDIYKCEMKMMKTLPLLHEEMVVKGKMERFFPFLYKLDVENKMFFMEDLKPKGYITADRTVLLDLNHVLLVMQAIAKMHASSFLFLKKNPSRREDYLDFFLKTKGGVITKLREGLYSYLLKSLHLWPISEEDKEIFRNLRTGIDDLFYNGHERRESSFNTIIHADFKSNNIMFKYKNGKVVAAKLIDFQGCHINSIALDLHYFLLSSVETKVILEHLDDIFKEYYDTFVSISGYIDGFTVDTVKKEFIERLPYGFVIATIFRPVMLSKNALDMDAFIQGRESQVNAAMLENKKYISDIVELLPIFKRHGIFK